MLSNNNLNISGISMHIIPVKLNYNGDSLKNIYVNEPIDFEKSSKTGNYINEKYDYIAKYFISSGDSVINLKDE